MLEFYAGFHVCIIRICDLPTFRFFVRDRPFNATKARHIGLPVCMPRTFFIPAHIPNKLVSVSPLWVETLIIFIGIVKPEIRSASVLRRTDIFDPEFVFGIHVFVVPVVLAGLYFFCGVTEKTCKLDISIYFV